MPDLAVMLLGSGLIGSAVLEALRRQFGHEIEHINYSWVSDQSRARARDEVASFLRESCEKKIVAIVWTAGSSGMGSSTEALIEEVNFVNELIEFASEVKQYCAGIHFHLMSSAGGLFEGQTFVDSTSIPLATRPYGAGKLREEEMLRQAAERIPGFVYTVYRPSSVYGFSVHGRLGLIPTLLGNGARHVSTRIIGRRETLRDYVFNEDIGRFVANRILGQIPVDCETVMLASGKSTSIGEIIEETEIFLNKRVFLQYDPAPTNASPMSFRPSALPRDFVITDLRTGLRRVALKLQTQWRWV